VCILVDIASHSYRFSAAGCSYFRAKEYTGLDACTIQPLLVNEFGQTLYLSGYNLTIIGFYEFYSQIAFRMISFLSLLFLLASFVFSFPSRSSSFPYFHS
jgi:hypothetical protein